MTKRRTNNLLAFLDARGLLENGSSEAIASARREYRRLYQRSYKRAYRTGHFEVRFTLDKSTVFRLRRHAKEEGTDAGTYAKEATLNSLEGKGPSSRIRMTRELLQTVSLIHSEIRHLCRQKPDGLIARRVTYEKLDRRLDNLEDELRESLRNDV